MMLNEKDLTPDQLKGIDHIYQHDNTLLVADMGAGKTVCALTAASELLRDGVLNRIFVVSTIKVARNVWATEPSKWEHLQHLNIKMAMGTIEERREGLRSDAEIVCINFENLEWLVNELYIDDKGRIKDDCPFDGIIIDEVSKLKSNSGTNFKAMRRVINKFAWRLTMTGTPVSEDWTGLFGEMYMTDGGKALGKNKSNYLEKYFYPTDYERRNWKLIPGQDEKILDAIGEVIYHLPDYRHELPELIEHTELIEMDSHTEIMYNNFKRDCIISMGDEEIVAPNAAALTGKLQQICQGFMYTENKEVHRMKTLKLDRLKDMLSGFHSYGPVVIVYWFKQDIAYLQEAFPLGVVLDGEKTIIDWNLGRTDILFLQPRSAGHGLNLALGGHNMVFYSQLWSNDLVKQTIARLWRRGQTEPVHIYHLIMNKTIDQLMSARIDSKTEYHSLLIKHLTTSKV